MRQNTTVSTGKIVGFRFNPQGVRPRRSDGGAEQVSQRPREPVRRVCGCVEIRRLLPPPLHDASTFVFSSSSGISICLTKQNDGAQCCRVCSLVVRSLLNSCAFGFIRRFQNRRLPPFVPESFVTPFSIPLFLIHIRDISTFLPSPAFEAVIILHSRPQYGESHPREQTPDQNHLCPELRRKPRWGLSKSDSHISYFPITFLWQLKGAMRGMIQHDIIAALVPSFTFSAALYSLPFPSNPYSPTANK